MYSGRLLVLCILTLLLVGVEQSCGFIFDEINSWCYTRGERCITDLGFLGYCVGCNLASHHHPMRCMRDGIQTMGMLSMLRRYHERRAILEE